MASDFDCIEFSHPYLLVKSLTGNPPLSFITNNKYLTCIKCESFYEYIPVSYHMAIHSNFEGG